MQAEAAPYQTRDGQRFHKGDFFYTPSDQPSDWKLLKTGTPGGEPDAAHVGAAVAALGQGFRGERVRIPAADRPAVLRKVRSAWKRLHPDASDDEMPDVLRAEDIALSLAAMALDLPSIPEHPNALPFSGILTRIDTPSDGAPDGAQRHRVLLPRAVAERALPSLLGMGIGVHATLGRHDPQHKVGVITEASIADGAIHVKGILYARDFPDEVSLIQEMSRQGVLGMSFELAHAEIADPDAEIWVIQSCVFTGAAILAKARAAYRTTALAAQEEAHMSAIDDAADDMAATQAVTIETVAAETGAASPESIMANAESMMKMMESMAGKMGMYEACMNAMDRVLGMRAGLDSLTEALEHLVQMHQALHEMGDGMDGGMKPLNAQQQEEAPMVAAQDEKYAKLEAMVTNLAAQVQLLTDQQSARSALATDGATSTARGLNTDTAPARRTMAATGEYAQFIGKYDGINAESEYTEPQLDKILSDAGVTDAATRMSVKIAMQREGRLVAAR